MKKKLTKILLLILLPIFSFGAGIAIAQIRLSYFSGNNGGKSSQAFSASQNSAAMNTNQPADTAANQPNSATPADVIPADDPPKASAENSSSENNKNSLSFAVIGDTKTFSTNPNGNLQKAVRSLAKQSFDFAFVMGDLVSSCDGGSSCEKKYESWKSIMAPILSKTYEVMGNHDRTGGDKADTVWQKEFNLPTNGPSGFSELTYSFDAVNSHFVVLNSEKPQEHIINDVQRNWLDNDLAANTKGNIFVFFHQPAFQMSQDAKDALDANPGERDQFWNILKKYKVTAVFNGHLHMIARKNQDGIEQFVIGDTDSTADDTPQKNLTDFGMTGHHYAIVSVNGKTVDVKIYSLDGNLENDFSF